MPNREGRIITVGVTGASGALLAQAALRILEDDARVTRVHLVVSDAGQRLFATELEVTSGDLKQLPQRVLGRPSTKIETLPNHDVGASIASRRGPCTAGRGKAQARQNRRNHRWRTASAPCWK